MILVAKTGCFGLVTVPFWSSSSPSWIPVPEAGEVNNFIFPSSLFEVSSPADRYIAATSVLFHSPLSTPRALPAALLLELKFNSPKLFPLWVIFKPSLSVSPVIFRPPES